DADRILDVDADRPVAGEPCYPDVFNRKYVVELAVTHYQAAGVLLFVARDPDIADELQVEDGSGAQGQKPVDSGSAHDVGIVLLGAYDLTADGSVEIGVDIERPGREGHRLSDQLERAVQRRCAVAAAGGIGTIPADIPRRVFRVHGRYAGVAFGGGLRE